MYPLVRALAIDGIPVTVTCRVLKIARGSEHRMRLRTMTTSPDGTPAVPCAGGRTAFSR